MHLQELPGSCHDIDTILKLAVLILVINADGEVNVEPFA